MDQKSRSDFHFSKSKFNFICENMLDQILLILNQILFLQKISIKLKINLLKYYKLNMFYLESREAAQDDI